MKTPARARTTVKSRMENFKIEAVNLRRDAMNPEIWRRAGLPRKIDDSDALPFSRFTPFGDGRGICLLLGGDNSLYYKAEPSTEAVFLAKLPGKLLLAVTSAKGVIRLLLSHQPDQYMTYDTDLRVTFHGAMPELPAIRIVASEYNTLSGRVPSVKLSGTSPVTSGSRLSAADNRQLTGALVATYDLLRQQAKELNYHVQPMMARYRLLDAAGSTIGVGPTIPVSVPEGFSATGSIMQVSDDNLQTLGEGRIEMKVYRPAVVAPAPLPEPWNRLVSKLVVEVTGEIEPLSREGEAPHGIQRDAASGKVTVTSRLPGFANGTVVDKARFRRLGMEGMKSPLHMAAEFNTPFDGGIGEPGTIHTFTAAEGNPATPSTAADLTPTAVGRSWSAALEAGEVTVLCNPCRNQPEGWSPDCFIASRDSGEGTVWRMAFSVTLSTPAGTVRVKRETGGLGNAPTSLSPVLTFPSSEATELTVSYLSPGGTVYEESFPLTPVPEMELACHVSPGLERISLTKTVEAYLPQGVELPPYREEGVAEIYSTADLGLRLDRRRLGSGRIHAVKVAPRSGSGWDFSRLKLLFFGEEGTSIATLDSSGKFRSFAPVDNRPVRSPEAVCEATGTSGACLLLRAGDDLVSISGQKATTLKASLSTLLHRYPSFGENLSIGWEETRHELWLSPADGRLFRLTEAGELIEARLPGINLTADNTTGKSEVRFRFTSDSGDLLIATPAGVYNLSDEEPAPMLEAGLRSRFRVDIPPRWLTLNLFASSLTGSFTLGGDRGTEIAEPLLRLHLDGAVNAPVTVRLAAPRRDQLEANLTVDASPDLTIHGTGITLDL